MSHLIMTSCAYKLSSNVDKLPGNINVLYIPIFINETKEPNVEVYFTNSLKTEVLRFGKISIADRPDQSQAILEGKIISIDYASDESLIESKDTAYLPFGTVLPTQVKVTVKVFITLTEYKTGKILWSSEFTQSKNYTPPQFTLPVINSANNLYNLSERRHTLESLSKDMMQLAFDRVVDNF